MDFEVEGVRPRGRPKKLGERLWKRIADPTNMQGRCRGP